MIIKNTLTLSSNSLRKDALEIIEAALLAIDTKNVLEMDEVDKIKYVMKNGSFVNLVCDLCFDHMNTSIICTTYQHNDLSMILYDLDSGYLIINDKRMDVCKKCANSFAKTYGSKKPIRSHSKLYAESEIKELKSNRFGIFDNRLIL